MDIHHGSSIDRSVWIANDLHVLCPHGTAGHLRQAPQHLPVWWDRAGGDRLYYYLVPSDVPIEQLPNAPS